MADKYSKTTWRGAQVKKKINQAVQFGINLTMSQAVIFAKNNHPGWKNITGFASGSTRVQEFAKKDSRGFIGKWGNVDAKYVRRLEFEHGSFLRNAGGVMHPNLARNIKQGFDKMAPA